MNEFKSNVPVMKTFARGSRLSVTLSGPLRLALWPWTGLPPTPAIKFSDELQTVLSRMDTVTILVHAPQDVRQEEGRLCRLRTPSPPPKTVSSCAMVAL